MKSPIARAAVAALVLSAASGAHAQQFESLIDPVTYRSLASDHRAQLPGDVITVYVLEATRARSQAGTDASSELQMSAHLDAPSTQYDASLGIGGSNSAGAQTTRLGELRTQISTRVVAVEPNGLLHIAGEQNLTVNGERQRIRLSGVVRPVDISADNIVWSNRIAHAELELVGVGSVSESQRQSIIYRAFKWLRLL